MLTLNQFQRLDAGQPINRSHPLMRGLVGRWQVAPGGHPSYRGGPKLRDMRHLDDGTLTNGPTWGGALGRKGGYGALNFDGSDDIVSVAATVPILSTANGSGFTFAAWVRMTSIIDAIQSAIEAVDNEGFARWQLAFTNSGTNHWKFAISVSGTGTDVADATSGFATSQWVHLVGTWDTSNIRIYVNGELNVEAASTLASVNSTQRPTLLGIGRAPDVTARAWPGQLDCLMVLLRALSRTEVKQLYDATSRPDDPTLNWLPMGFVNSAAAATAWIAPAAQYQFFESGDMALTIS